MPLTLIDISDFNLYQMQQGSQLLWHWEGKGRYSGYCSEEGFINKNSACVDAIAFLRSLADADDSEPDFEGVFS